MNKDTCFISIHSFWIRFSLLIFLELHVQASEVCLGFVCFFLRQNEISFKIVIII